MKSPCNPEGERPYESDDALLSGLPPLRCEGEQFSLGDGYAPIVGSTYMSTSVSRDFLHAVERIHPQGGSESAQAAAGYADASVSGVAEGVSPYDGRKCIMTKLTPPAEAGGVMSLISLQPAAIGGLLMVCAMIFTI